MTSVLRDGASAVLLVSGVLFFVAGTVGLLRFPDLSSRLHAVTKADGLGLGLVTAGLVVASPSVAVAAKLLLIWAVALTGSSVACHLVAARDVRAAAARPDSERRRDG